MIKKFTYITAAPIFLVLSLFLISATPYFYNFEFKKNNTYQVVNLPASEVPKVVNHLAGYLGGVHSNFNHQVMIDGVMTNVYGQREVLHMQDVRAIFDGAKYLSIVFLCIILVQLFICKRRSELSNYLKKLSSAGVIGMIVISVMLLLLILTDFSSAFIKFHQLFFNNDLWLLDPRTDRLIQMLPEVFFRDAALSIIGLSFLLVIAFKTIVSVVSRRQHA